MAVLVNKDLAQRTVEAVKNLQKDITQLTKQSDDALKTFRDTVDNLDKINAAIDEKVELADAHIKEFETLKGELLTKREGNVKVSSKIREFLG